MFHLDSFFSTEIKWTVEFGMVLEDETATSNQIPIGMMAETNVKDSSESPFLVLNARFIKDPHIYSNLSKGPMGANYILRNWCKSTEVPDHGSSG